MVLGIQYVKVLNYVIIVSLLTTSLTTGSISNINAGLFPIVNELESNNISYFELNANMVLPNPYQNPKIQYTPINSMSEDGSTFSINDEVAVSHADSVSLDSGNSWQDSFTIQQLAGFNDNYLEYGITISAEQDSYVIHDTVENKHQALDSGQIRIAQAFQISWDYGVIFSAEINLVIDGPTLGSDEIELFIVKADGLGAPDLGDIRAYETNGPYNSSNTIPTSSYGNYGYYAFQNTTMTGEAVLERGTYFIVIELTVVDNSNDEYDWLGKQGVTAGYPCYVHDGASWSQISDETRGLVVNLLPSYSNGSALSFTDPTSIVLTDNAVPVTSLSQEISGSGVHTLSSNTSVSISLSNTYSFDRTLSATSNFVVTNSSHLAETVDWTLSWSIGSLNLFTYTNPSRTQEIITSSDWNDTIFDLLVNGTDSISGFKSSLGYDFDLNTILSGNKYDSGDFEFTTSSLNYLYDLNLNDNIFNLGSWTTNDTHATGVNGSTILADVFIKDSFSIDEISGELNFTIYDPDGNIIPLKVSVPANIIYQDITEYSILQLSQISAGKYSLNTVFDPSIYGSDSEGYWTVTCLWLNGSEVGFYSQRISVSKSTTASFRWEASEGGSWSSNSSNSITRIDEETIRVQIEYNNISDPYFLGEGTPITAAPVSFTTTWGTSGQLTYVGPYYESYISLNATEGIQSIDLLATGAQLQAHSEKIEINVLHTFDIQSLPDATFEAYYEDDFSLIQFRVRDLSDGNLPVVPDELFVYLDDVLLTQIADYDTTNQMDRISLHLYSSISDLNLTVGTYTIRIEATKESFVVDYGIDTVTIEVGLEILPITTELQLVGFDEEIYQNNVTTITFLFVDTIHDENITGANIDVSFDIIEASIVDIFETDGLYTVKVRVLEPQETSIHITITVSKNGYVSVINHPVADITIKIPGEPEGIPTYLFVILGVFGGAIIIVPLVFVIRRSLNKEKRAQKALFSRIYGLYESVLSITKIIIVHKATGLPVYEMDLGSEISLDPSLITGFLSAISSMGVELRGDRAGSVKRLQYKNFFVTGTESGQFTIYTFSETDLNDEIEERLTVISEWFAKMFNQVPEDWDGSTEIFRINLQGITEKIMKEIHLWIFYPFIVSPYKTQEIEELSGLRKLLVEYVIEHDNVTISRIFDDLDHIKIDRGLPIIFEFIENGIITPVFDAYKIATVRF